MKPPSAGRGEGHTVVGSIKFWPGVLVSSFQERIAVQSERFRSARPLNSTGVWGREAARTWLRTMPSE